MTEGTKLVGYVRVSTEQQGDEGAGLEAQRKAIRLECERRGWQLDRIEPDVLSGRTMKRPGLEAALADCRSGKVAGIVVAKLDRLSRSVIDFATLVAEANRGGWNIVALDFGLDLSTPQGKLVANVLMAVAEWEREIIGQRTREGLAVKRSQGVRVGRPQSVPQSVVRRIKTARSRGNSFATIAERLNRDRVPTGHGGARWHPSTVRSVLHRV